ncbi:Uncharacterised protein [Candidatus Norongarragalina meridionalis]|nr:Uncharacterised protein [Candidatus Norongarragalina meridionalis]
MKIADYEPVYVKCKHGEEHGKLVTGACIGICQHMNMVLTDAHLERVLKEAEKLDPKKLKSEVDSTVGILREFREMQKRTKGGCYIADAEWHAMETKLRALWLARMVERHAPENGQ